MLWTEKIEYAKENFRNIVDFCVRLNVCWMSPTSVSESESSLKMSSWMHRYNIEHRKTF